ncbi:MAG: hypothetical protein IPG45_05830 [Deltaproteobacteria bacterium]|nr:hypothetical protein [Deltaproteobacteria bacterium]
MRWAPGLLLLLGACGTDVNLGRPPTRADGGLLSGDAGPLDLGSPDLGALDGGAPVDGGALPDAGPSAPMLRFFSNPEVGCQDAWAGLEEDFSAVPPTSVGLRGGVIRLEIPTATRATYLVSGPPITAGLGVSSLELVHQPFDLPAGFYGVAIEQSGPGPQGSQRRSAIFLIDTINSPPPPYECTGGIELSDATYSGSCFLTYRCTITP